jgi:hypothetical protein
MAELGATWPEEATTGRCAEMVTVANELEALLDKLSLLARADAVIATSPPYAEASATLAPWRDKVHVIPLGIADPQVQSLMSDAWARSYMSTRLAVLEGTVQEVLRRSETYRVALEMAVMDDAERAKLIEQASKQIPAQFETLPE